MLLVTSLSSIVIQTDSAPPS
nr:unnamed protein product [Callosobruchus chinensis]